MYLTLAQANQAIARIINVYKVDGTIDDDFLQLTIDEAEGLVNSAIGSRYDIPVTGTNAVAYLRALVIPILRFKTYTQFAESLTMPDNVKTEYETTMIALGKLARQVMSLPDTSDKTTGRPSYVKITESTTPSTGF